MEELKLKASENTLRIIWSVEKTHLNLGLPIVFAKIIDLANLGCFIVADRGKGKTTILKTMVPLRHRDVLLINILTYAGLPKLADKLNGREVTLLNYDFSSFYTEYLRDVGVNLISQLITEGRVKAETGKYTIEIADCKISFLSAMQPQMLRKLNRASAWESMYKDRFIRLFLLYPFGTPKYREHMPNVPMIEWTLANPEQVSIPKEIKRSTKYERVRMILARQTSEGRSRLYLDRLLKAKAYLDNRDIALMEDLEFIELYAPYLLLDFILSKRDTVAAPLVLNPNSYLVLFYLIEHGAAQRKEMQRHFQVSYQTMLRALKPLQEIGVIKGTWGADEYKVNPKWYEKYILPIIKFAEANEVIK